MQIYLNETTRKPWPRWAVSPDGRRAIFACQGDIPPGWELEVPLPVESQGSSDAVIAELMRQVSALTAAQTEKKGKAG